MPYRLARFGALVALFTAAPLAAADGPVLSYSAAADTAIATLTREHGMVRGVQDAPLVQVYGDGRVVVTRPSYMIAAGVHEFALDSAGLDALVATVAPVADLDAERIATRRDAAQRATGERFFTLDETVTRIDIKLDSLVRNGAAPRSVDHSIQMANVQIDAQRLSGVTGLATLAQAEKALLALFDRPRLAAQAKEQAND